ncbi:hypothetical protein LTR08_001633 [Meristemomyces frigidus]|nr:hypothetical protein LTR08_001633 [Meristemomyces frigidus]
MALPSTTTTQPQPAPPNPLNLPPPQLFDILPALHELLARIDHAPSASDPSPSSTSSASNYAPVKPLDPKDLPTAILPLKAQMRKGLRAIERLPDIARSVQEQDDEIAELEARITRQDEVLRGLARCAGEAEGELGSMKRVGKVDWD